VFGLSQKAHHTLGQKVKSLNEMPQVLSRIGNGNWVLYWTLTYVTNAQTCVSETQYINNR